MIYMKKFLLFNLLVSCAIYCMQPQETVPTLTLKIHNETNRNWKWKIFICPHDDLATPQEGFLDQKESVITVQFPQNAMYLNFALVDSTTHSEESIEAAFLAKASTIPNRMHRGSESIAIGYQLLTAEIRPTFELHIGFYNNPGYQYLHLSAHLEVESGNNRSLLRPQRTEIFPDKVNYEADLYLRGQDLKKSEFKFAN